MQCNRSVTTLVPSRYFTPGRPPLLRTYLFTVLAALAIYFLPLAVMALCLHVGWYAHPEPVAQVVAPTTPIPIDTLTVAAQIASIR